MSKQLIVSDVVLLSHPKSAHTLEHKNGTNTRVARRISTYANLVARAIAQKESRELFKLLESGHATNLIGSTELVSRK